VLCFHATKCYASFLHKTVLAVFCLALNLYVIHAELELTAEPLKHHTHCSTPSRNKLPVHWTIRLRFSTQEGIFSLPQHQDSAYDTQGIVPSGNQKIISQT